MFIATEQPLNSLNDDQIQRVVSQLHKQLGISVDFNFPELPGLQFWNALEADLTKSLAISSATDIDQGRKNLSEILAQVIEDEKLQLSSTDFDQLLDSVVDHYFGLGILDLLLRDDSIYEVLINSFQEVYFERKGKLQRAPFSFWSEAHLNHVIDRFCARNNMSLPSGENSVIRFTLPDNSPVTILFPPVTSNPVALSIRRFTKNPIAIDQLIKWGSISAEMLQFLKGCVEAGLNIMVCGHLGSGANTIVNILSSFVPGDERIISVERERGFSLRMNHLIKLIAAENPTDENSYRKLLKLSERMRGDRLFLGEFSSFEAYDVLNTINDNFWGSIIKFVAKSPVDAINRLETLMQMDKPSLPVPKIRHLIGSSIDLIVYQERLNDGTRVVKNIVEVLDETGSNEQVALKEIFGVVQTGIKDGRILRRFVSYGRPSEKFMNKIESIGIHFPPSLFATGTDVEKPKELTETDKRVIKLSKGNYVFISYSNKDLARILPLARELEKNNFSVWLDKWYLEPGEDWSKGLEKAIKNAGAFLVILTPNSVDAAAVRGEILTAQDERLPIIPVKMEECNIPIQIKTLQYIVYQKNDLIGAASQITETLSKYISNQGLIAEN